ncbi:MAG TPA: phosphodiesterase [Burkholderiaceae bacterium]|nr:phosphodiesterase [Burkholderiaceae bacterium]
MTTTLLQISDLHIREPGRLAYGRVETAKYLKVTIESILTLRQRPDAVVITGDLVDFGRVAEYRHLKSLLEPLQMPLYLLPGNHDDRAALRTGFPDHAYLHAEEAADFVQYSVPVGELRMIALDTVVPRAGHGELCERRLDWLDSELERWRGQPVVIAMHHPPFVTGVGHMDKVGLLAGIEELEAIVRRHPNIERIICGHLHRAIDTRFGGTLVSTTPAPAHQVTLDLSPDAPASFTMEPPAFRLHVWNPAHGMVTHLAFAGRFEGPYPFREEGRLNG